MKSIGLLSGIGRLPVEVAKAARAMEIGRASCRERVSSPV